MERSTRERIDATLEPLGMGSRFALQVDFNEDSQLLNESGIELKRLIKLLKNNPGKRIEIGVHTDEVVRDTIPQPGLTEVIIDTIFQEVTPLLASEQEGDSVLIVSDQPEELFSDSVAYTLSYTYHNDHTERRAQLLADYLMGKGVPEHLIEFKGYGDSMPKVPNDDEDSRALNRRVEATVIE